MRAAMPEYAAIHSHVLQDVLARLDKTYQAFFRRLARDRTRAGLPALSGAQSLQHFHLQGVRQRRTIRGVYDNGFLVFSKIGRIAVRWSRPLEGTPKTVTISPGGGRLVRLHLVRRGADAADCRSPDRKPALILGWNRSPRWRMAR